MFIMIPAPVTQWHRPLRLPAALLRQAGRNPFICSTCMMLFVLFFLASCKGNSKEASKKNIPADDSLQTVSSIASEDSIMIFSNAENWINKSIQKNSIDWNKFHLTAFWSDDSLQSKPFTPETDFYKDYAQVLRWSPDSAYILDIGSYGSVKIKDNKTGNTKIEGGEPDTEVSLINPKTKTRTRLLFFGPSTVISDARWLNASQVAILGEYDENGDHQPDTLLWLINTKENFFRTYRWE